VLGAMVGGGWAGQGGGRGAALTEKLENVFSAPLDAITGFFTKVHSLLSVQIRGRISLAKRREAQPPGSHFPVPFARICALVRSTYMSNTGMWTNQPHMLLIGRSGGKSVQELEEKILIGSPQQAVHASEGQGTGGVQLNHLAKLSSPEVELHPSSVAPGTRLDVSTAQGPLDITVLSLPDAAGRVDVSSERGGVRYTGRVRLSPLDASRQQVFALSP